MEQNRCRLSRGGRSARNVVIDERAEETTTMTDDTKGRVAAVTARARAIRGAGGIDAAIARGTLPKLIETTLSEALVLGLLKQGVRKYLAIFGQDRKSVV